MRNFRLQLAHRLLSDTTSRSHTTALQQGGEGEGRGGAGDRRRGRGPLAGHLLGDGRAGSQQGCDPTVGAQSKRGKGRAQQQRGSAGTSPLGRREADTRTRGVVQDQADSPKAPRNQPSPNDPNRPSASKNFRSAASSLQTAAQRTLQALWTPTQKTRGKMQPARRTPAGRQPVRKRPQRTPQGQARAPDSSAADILETTSRTPEGPPQALLPKDPDDSSTVEPHDAPT